MELLEAQMVKNLLIVGDLGSTPDWEDSGEGSGYSFRYSCLENFIERRAWQTIVQVGLQESRVIKHFH